MYKIISNFKCLISNEYYLISNVEIITSCHSELYPASIYDNVTGDYIHEV